MADRSEPDPDEAERVRDILAIVSPRDPGGRPLTPATGSNGGHVGAWAN